MQRELAQRISIVERKPFSPTFAGGILRIIDLLIIFIVGLDIYGLYVFEAELSTRYLATILIGTICAGVVFQWMGVYREDYVFSKQIPLQRVLLAWTVAFSLLLFFAFALKITDFYSRVWTVSWFIGTAVLIVVTRIMTGRWLSRMAQEGRIAYRTIILGAGDKGQRLAAHLREFGDIRIKIVGFIEDNLQAVAPGEHSIPILGNTLDLVDMIRKDKVDQVFVALSENEEKRLQQLIFDLSMTPVRVCLAPDWLKMDLPKRSFLEIGHLPMLQVSDRPISGWDHVRKELFDRIVGGLALAFVSPLMLLIALAIKLDSKGPVFFRQNRYGYNNTLISVWKFRTMYVESTDANCAVQTMKNDPRVTRVGDFLRKSSLDELPQLFNVVAGDMSLVGPRPHAIETKAEGKLFPEVVERYVARHRVKPGITGWAQVNGWRGETDTIEKIQKRVEYDLYYIDNWSIWFDVYILIKTFLVVFKDDRAY